MRVFPMFWLIGSPACAVHRVGMLEAGDPPVLVSVEAGRERLVLLGDQARLGGLDAHLVEIDGRKTLGKVVVSAHRALEGPHAMPVVYGPLQQLGSQVGVADVGSGMFVRFDDRSAEALWGNPGAWIAVEGWFDGPQRFVAVAWVFAEPPAPDPAGG